MRGVVVSGGGSGIGRAVAYAFAGEGERVVILGRRGHVLEEAAAAIARAHPDAPPVATVRGDLTCVDEVERAADDVVRHAPTVDVLVHCAGGAAGNRPGSTPAEDGLAAVEARWLADWRLNLLSVVLLTEALDGHLASPGGRVVLLSSIAAYRGSGSYGSAKAALHPYAYHLARELGPRGITANAVAPGYTTETEFFGDQMTPARHRMLIDETATGRPASPAEVAETIVWLASSAAGQITGQVVQVNGGAMMGR
jgi:3-oxoacyl-[acyl-carrier protein] reductase